MGGGEEAPPLDSPRTSEAFVFSKVFTIREIKLTQPIKAFAAKRSRTMKIKANETEKFSTSK